MFKYIAYDKIDDTLIMTNNYVDYYVYGNTPQRCEYFKSEKEAIDYIIKYKKGLVY